MKVHSLGLTAAAAAQSDLVQTGVWNVLRQRFYALALDRPSVADAEGWTDRDSGEIADAVDVLLRGMNVSRSSEDDGTRAWLGTLGDGDGRSAVLVHLDPDGGWRATACGPDDVQVSAMLTGVAAAFPAPKVDSSTPAIFVRFWALGSMGPISFQRRLDVTRWADARQNYPADVREQLDRLMSNGPPQSGGKLMLLHGPPGTGKTRVTESLADAWSSWCDVDFVTDADNFFGHAAYLISTMVMGADTDRWRLVVIEDAGEFLMAGRDDRPTQGLARLLNLADGMVGQGLKLLVLMTTNEDVDELHSAVVRPGRCLAQIGFVPFTHEESVAWLAAHESPRVDLEARERTLADLYAELQA